jgi:hypothetical protein
LLLRCLELLLLGSNQIDKTIRTHPSVAYILSERLDRVHACYGSKTTARQLRQFCKIFKKFGRTALAEKSMSARLAVGEGAAYYSQLRSRS